MRRKRGKMRKKGENHSDPIYTNPIKKLPMYVCVKSGKSLENVCSGLFRDFFQTFWDPAAGGPGRLFSDFLGISGPEGPRDSCSSREGSQYVCVCVCACVRACVRACARLRLRARSAAKAPKAAAPSKGQKDKNTKMEALSS